VLSSLLLRNLPGPVRLFALAGLIFVVGVFGSIAVAATQRALAPDHAVPVDSLHQAVGVRGPGLLQRRRAPQRRPAGVTPRSLARGVHPHRRIPGPLPETSAAVAPAQPLPTEPTKPGPRTLPVPPVAKAAPPPFALPEEEPTPPVEPPAEEPAPEEPAPEEPPVEPPHEEPPAEEPAPEEPAAEEPAPEEPPVEEPAPEEPAPEEPAPEEPAPEEPPVEEPAPEEPPVEEPGPVLPPLREAGFENGLFGWNLAGVGDEVPTVVSDIVRTGANSGRVLLTGSEGRSELIFGGNGSGSTSGTAEFREGDEYWYGFSFYILQMVWGHPGAHNLVMQFKSDGEGSPAFGLDLWDYQGHRGLWSEGSATGGGNRFLAPLSEDAWYDVAIHFRASERGAGFYETFLNGRLIDARQNISMIVPGKGYAYIKNGIYRGQEIPGTSEIRLDSAKLGTSLAAVSP
jgi:hypothetical protein